MPFYVGAKAIDPPNFGLAPMWHKHCSLQNTSKCVSGDTPSYTQPRRLDSLIGTSISWDNAPVIFLYNRAWGGVPGRVKHLKIESILRNDNKFVTSFDSSAEFVGEVEGFNRCPKWVTFLNKIQLWHNGIFHPEHGQVYHWSTSIT